MRYKNTFWAVAIGRWQPFFYFIEIIFLMTDILLSYNVNTLTAKWLLSETLYLMNSDYASLQPEFPLRLQGVELF